MKVVRLLAGLAPLMLLTSCLLMPGKFTASLDIRADRSFTYSYSGEIIASDPSKGLDNLKTEPSADGDDESKDVPQPKHIKPAKPDADTEAKMRAIAEALSKEQGYRSVRYMGEGKFLVDYQISGRLDHAFVFPYNADAQAVFPFLIVELRNDGKVRVQAPGFAASKEKTGMGDVGMGEGTPNPALNGTFTLITDAEIVSQNQEDGPTTTPKGKQIVWKASPLTRTAPMATLRFAR